MNKRWKELLEEATEVYDDWKTGASQRLVDHKMFAELIVRECLKEIKDMIVDESEQLYPNNKQTTEYVNDRLMDAHDNIAEHFGVEE